jgi:hypothetical protein
MEKQPMSVRRFYQNVRLARSLLGRSRVAVDDPRGRDAKEMGEGLDRSDMWLTPRVVAGFDPADFEFLDRASQDRLKGAVDSFLAIAREVPLDRPATEEQARDGRRYLEEVVQVLEIGAFPDLDHFKAAKVLENLQGLTRLPAEIEKVAWQFDISSRDRPMVWVWGLTADGNVSRSRLQPLSAELRDRVDDEFAKYDVSIEPLVSLRTLEEQKKIESNATPEPYHSR